MVRPLLNDPYSHTVTALLGRTRPAYPVEDMALFLIEAYREMHRGKNQVRPEPIDRPWNAPVEKQAPVRSRTEREAGRARLRERLGITE